ncbi:MAG: ABC transporter transmembrane domain-containing protein, partial [Epibacterium sp.]|nr:ABC transporter transmembrane domain-containing protein [Epibacterium sp.]NQX76074.1 ABC transporter ATP-binding protein [Epibacterium sp.]
MGDNQLQKTPQSGLKQLIAPVWPRLRLACWAAGIGAAAGMVPYIAMAEMAQVLMSSDASDSQVVLAAAVAVAALFVRLACNLAAGSLAHFADADLQLHLARRISTQLSQVPLGWFADRDLGEIRKAMRDDPAALHHRVAHGYTDLVTVLTAPLVALAYLFWCGWQLALVGLLPAIVGMALYAVQFRGYRTEMQRYEQGLSDLNAAAMEYAGGIAVIKTFRQGGQAFSRFQASAARFLEHFHGWVSRMTAISAVTEVVLSPFFAVVLMLAAGVVMAGQGWIAPVEVIPFLILAPGLTAPFGALAFAQRDIMQSDAAADRIAALLETPRLDAP